jgi:hypothetical protein
VCASSLSALYPLTLSPSSAPSLGGSANAFATWNTQLKSCCSASPPATCGGSVPQGCTSASFGNYHCPPNTYIKNGGCAPCGSGASSPGAMPNTIVQSVSCGE